MSERKQPLTMTGLGAMATEVGTQSGPSATTKVFNRRLIEEFRANGGVVQGELAAVNFLLLTTKSARNGAPRTTPLVYHRIDGRLIVIASTGGGPRNPAWFDNLVHDPSVTVEINSQTWTGRAVVLSGADRGAVFAAVVASVPTFGQYQARTARIIPAIELFQDPGSGSAGEPRGTH